MSEAELSYEPKLLAALHDHLYRRIRRASRRHRGIAKSALSAWLNQKGRPHSDISPCRGYSAPC